MGNDYRPLKSGKAWIGRTVRARRVMTNGMGQFPAGSLWTVDHLSAGLSLTGEACPCCGVRPRVSKVSPQDVTLIPEGERLDRRLTAESLLSDAGNVFLNGVPVTLREIRFVPVAAQQSGVLFRFEAARIYTADMPFGEWFEGEANSLTLRAGGRVEIVSHFPAGFLRSADVPRRAVRLDGKAITVISDLSAANFPDARIEFLSGGDSGEAIAARYSIAPDGALELWTGPGEG